MNNISNDVNFKFATAAIKVIAVIIAMMVFAISQYAFIFFSAAMLPTLFAVFFFDITNQNCASATICTFNLMGILPYLIKIGGSSSIDYTAKMVIIDFSSWLVVYGAAFLGQLLYIVIPFLIAKLYLFKSKAQHNILQQKYVELSSEWGIKTENNNI